MESCVKKKLLDNLWNWVKVIFFAIIIVFFVKGFLLIPISVDGNSMVSTLQEEDQLVVEKISKLRRFDVIVFNLPGNATYIKRIIGIPGDTIRYQNDQLYVNNKKVSEKFLNKNKEKLPAHTNYTPDFDLVDIIGEKKVPAHTYFVLGDNRRISKDSRSFGVVDSKYIFGKAVWIYYPLHDFGAVQ